MPANYCLPGNDGRQRWRLRFANSGILEGTADHSLRCAPLRMKRRLIGRNLDENVDEWFHAVEEHLMRRIRRDMNNIAGLQIGVHTTGN